MSKTWLQVPNRISFRQRATEIIIDYLSIVAYLGLLAVVTLLAYYIFLQGIPSVTMMQSQTIALFTSVLPVILYFSYVDFRKRGSYGKRVAKLTVRFKTKQYWRSLVRNCIKFLPWQLAHMGVIDGMYTDFSDVASQVFVYASLALAVILFTMMLFRKDKRHLGDMIAGTQVVSSH